MPVCKSVPFPSVSVADIQLLLGRGDAPTGIATTQAPLERLTFRSADLLLLSVSPAYEETSVYAPSLPTANVNTEAVAPSAASDIDNFSETLVRLPSATLEVYVRDEDDDDD